MSENSTRHLVTVDTDSANATYTSDFQRSVAAIIGINDYGNGIPRLNTAVNDARQLAELLRNKHNYTVHLLTEDVTKTRLTDFLRLQLPGEIDQVTRLLLYFACHGVVLDSEDGPAGYLVPQDANTADTTSFLPMSDLHAWLEALPCRHVLLILDCCFAGAIRWNSTRNLTIYPQQIYRERYQLFVRSPAWQAITSAAYDEKALDILKTGDIIGRRAEGVDKLHSPFALALFDALAGAGDTYPPGLNGQQSGDGLLTANELFQYLRDNVALKAQQSANHRQTPGLWPLKKHHAGEYVFQVPGRSLNLEPAPPLSTKNNPYRGLKSYEEQDAPLFFGRTQLIAQLAQQVAVQPLTLVLGASGTGKSSVVKAGLSSYLRHQGDNASTAMSWYILPPMRPSDQPLSTLAKLLHDELEKGKTTVAEEQGVGEIESTRVYLFDDPTQFIARWRETHSTQRLLLVIDQFEELITLCRSEEERNTFLNQLVELVKTHADQLRLVITLRTDFEPQFADLPLFKQQVTHATRFVVPPMSQAELREVIEKPAMLRVLYFDPPELVDRLINEVVQTPGALPLLSFTLEQLYLKYLARQEAAQRLGQTIDRSFTIDDYDTLGGVIGSLRTRADEEYNRLPDEAHQATMVRVMLRMVAVEGGEVARRRVPLAELNYPNDEENVRVEKVIARLVEARLIIRDSVDMDGDTIGDTYIEPAHDALVRAWDRLRTWQVMAEQELPLSLHRTLTQSAGDWRRVRNEDKSGLLWNNSPWLSQLHREILPELEEQFDALDYWLDPGLLFHSIEQVRTKPTRFNQQETEFIIRSAERRKLLWRRALGITLAVMVALATIAAVALVQRKVAITERDRANANATEAVRQADIALSRQLATQTRLSIRDEPDLALLLSLEAREVADTIEARSSIVYGIEYNTQLHTFLRGHTDWVRAMRFSPDGNTLATSSKNSEIIIWNLKTYQPQYKIMDPNLHGDISAVVFSPTGDLLAASSVTGKGNKAGVIALWDMKMDQPHLRTIITDTNKFLGLAFSPDGQTLFAATERMVLAWNTRTATRSDLFLIEENYVREVQFNHDGTHVAFGSETGKVILVDLASGSVLTHNSHDGLINDIAFSTDDKQVASAGSDNKVALWHIAQNQIDTLGEHTEQVQSVAFSPDGTTLISGSRDERVIEWDISVSPPTAKSLNGHRDWVLSVAFSPDGQKFASGSVDHNVIIWNVIPIPRLKELQANHDDEVWSVAFSPDGKQLASAGKDATLILTTIATNTSMTLTRGDYPIRTIAYAPDGSKIAAGDENGQISLWNLPIKSLQPISLTHDSGQFMTNLLFSADSRILASTSRGIPLILWDLTQNPPIRNEFSHDLNKIIAITFDPDLKHLLTADDGGKLNVWDVTSHQLLQQMEFPNNVSAAAFSVDGASIAWGTDDGQIIWLDLVKNNVLARISHRTGGIARSLRFSANGRLLVSGSEDGDLIFWDTLFNGQIGEAIHAHKMPISMVTISPDSRYVASASDDKTAAVWSIDVDSWVTLACRIVQRNMTTEEWLQYLGQKTYHETCPWRAG